MHSPKFDCFQFRGTIRNWDYTSRVRNFHLEPGKSLLYAEPFTHRTPSYCPHVIEACNPVTIKGYPKYRRQKGHL